MFSLVGCSSKTNRNDILTVFDALDSTLEATSAHIKGTLEYSTDDKNIISLDISYIQEDNLQVKAIMDLESNKNKIPDYLQFYIKDGKTYLKNLDTTSQSVVENIGLQKDGKISVFNPFTSYTDDKLVSFFTSSSKKGDTYNLELDPKQVATLIDSMGTLSISKCSVQATIKDDYLENISLTLDGYMAYSDYTSDVNIVLNCDIDQINSLSQITFPDDLTAY